MANPLKDQVTTEFWFAGQKITDFKFGLSALKKGKFTYRVCLTIALRVHLQIVRVFVEWVTLPSLCP